MPNALVRVSSRAFTKNAQAAFVLSLALVLGCEAKSRTLAGGKARDVPSASSPLKAERSPAEVVDAGCPHADGASCHHDAGSGASQTTPVQLYGSPFSANQGIQATLADILHTPEKYHEQTVIVAGYVQRACSRRGCWMEITPNAEANATGCRVTFKDYGFLVPTDAQGSTARLSGTVQVTVIPAAAVAHYESEGGTFKNKQADGSAREVRIVATGVELTRRS